MREKKWATFLIAIPFMHALESPVCSKNMTPGVLLEPYMSEGGPGCHRDTYCIERVKKTEDTPTYVLHTIGNVGY